jgi:hypothetical protein
MLHDFARNEKIVRAGVIFRQVRNIESRRLMVESVPVIQLSRQAPVIAEITHPDTADGTHPRKIAEGEIGAKELAGKHADNGTRTDTRSAALA